MAKRAGDDCALNECEWVWIGTRWELIGDNCDEGCECTPPAVRVVSANADRVMIATPCRAKSLTSAKTTQKKVAPKKTGGSAVKKKKKRSK